MAAGSAKGVDRDGLEELLKLLVHDPKHITPELVDERYEVLKTQSKDVFGRMRVPDLSPRLGEITAPILGFWASRMHSALTRAISRYWRLARTHAS